MTRPTDQPPLLVSVACTRTVWAAVTRTPSASIRELAQVTGYTYSPVRYALQRLEQLGYIRAAHRKGRARTVLVPLFETQ